MYRRLSLAGLLSCVAGVAMLAAQAQQTPPATQSPQAPTGPVPTFRAEVEYVEVDAVVTDAQGQFVRDLKKDDFQVFEDGKRQTVTNFSLVDIPIERATRPLFASAPLEPDVYSNERPFDGRVYVVVLDDLHVSFQRTQRVRASLTQFIERNMGVNDLMAVLFTGGRSADAQEFTNNKRLLIAAVNKFQGQKLRSPTLNKNDDYYRQQGAGIAETPRDQDEQQRAYNARSMLSTLQRVSEWFGGVRGRRKALVLVSEGIDYEIYDIVGQAAGPSSQVSSIVSDIHDAIVATERANVSIYAVDPRGLTTLGDDTIEVTSFADSDDPTTGIGTAALQRELRTAQDGLRSLSEETGGFAAVNRNDLANAFDRIVQDTSSYYVLAYYPPSDKRDGKFHRIEVKTTRPGLTVRSRRGYASPKGKPAAAPKSTMPPELLAAVNSPMPISGLTMKAFAAPFKGTAPNASVLVGAELRGRDLSLEANTKVDFTFMAVDLKGKIYGGKVDSISMNLRPETRTRVEQSGIRVLNRLDLPPGRYQLRVAARDSAKDTTGSIIYDLEIPDFYKLPFTMSGLAVTSLGSGAMVNAKSDDQLKAVLPASPVAQRTFAQNDELAVFAEVYDNSGTAPHKVDLLTSVRTDDGRVVFKNEESRDSSELQGAKGGYGFTTRVPLSDIPPGTYVLTVEGRSRAGKEVGAGRQIQFDVVARR